MATTNNDKIKTIRATTGLTQEEFCRRFGLSISTLRSWEQGKRNCPDSVVYMLEHKALKKD